MDIEDSNKNGFLKMEALERFEKSLGCTLPEDYRDFLIKHNGGTPDKYLVCWPGSSEPSEVWNDSLGLHSGPTYSRLDYVSEGLKEYLPKGVIPFASDPGGNYFCIGIAGEYAGKVYFWDHERSEDDENISFLSETFTEFFEGLVSDEDA